MRVLVSSTVGAGHFGPLLQVVEAMRRRGDDLCLVVPPGLRERAEAVGVPYRLGAEPSDELTAIWDRVPTVSKDEASILVNREIFGRLDTAALLPAVELAYEQIRPDLVVHEAAEYAGPAVAMRHGIRHVQIAIGLARVESSSLDLAAPALAAYGDDLVDGIRRSAYLTRLPESLDPSPYELTLRFVEPTPPIEWDPPSWPDGMADRPLVYVSFGTVASALELGAEAYRVAVEAVRELPARILITTGRARDVAELGPLPPHVVASEWVPQDEVLARADLVVCHGGAGTTFGALAAGAPLVVVPLMADQPRNGRLVAEAGAAIVVAAEAGSIDSEALATAMRTVLGTPSYRRSAERISAEMAQLSVLDDVLESIAP